METLQVISSIVFVICLHWNWDIQSIFTNRFTFPHSGIQSDLQVRSNTQANVDLLTEGFCLFLFLLAQQNTRWRRHHNFTLKPLNTWKYSEWHSECNSFAYPLPNPYRSLVTWRRCCRQPTTSFMPGRLGEWCEKPEGLVTWAVYVNIIEGLTMMETDKWWGRERERER